MTTLLQTYHHYAANVLYLALSILHNEQDAEDVVQDVFMKYFSNMDKIKAGTEKYWLIAVTKRKCLDVLKAKRRMVNVDDIEIAEECAAVKAEVVKTLYSAVERLNTKPRRLVKMYLEGYKPAKIAQLLGRSEQTVWNQHCGAVKKLKLFFS